MDAQHLKEAIAGRYTGSGRGIYPTIQPFEYSEYVSLTLSPKGFLIYSQQTSNLLDQTPMHIECGYLRISSDLDVEFLISQPTGVSEIATGVATIQKNGGIELNLASTISLARSAKRVTEVLRRYYFDVSGMRYELHMATENVDLTLHLTAALMRGGV